MNIKNLIRNNILDLIPYSSARDEFKSTENFIYLDANESSYNNKLNRYPDNRHIHLRSMISSYKNINIDRLILCNGTDELIDLVIRVFCNPGIDKIITLNPTYGMYNVSAKINNIENITVNLDSGFQIDTDRVIAKFDTNTKIIFITNPNNPTGNVFDDRSITKIIERFEGIVFIDEAYVDYSKKSFLKKLKSYNNLIISQTFSKALGLAGIRLGVGYASEEIIDYLNKVKPPYNINTLTEKKAINSISEYYVNSHQVNETIAERINLVEKLNKIKCVIKVFPSNSNFILVEFDDANKIYNQLIDNKIVVRNRSNIEGCNNCLRITVGTPKQNEILIKTLNNL
jgi:histidinol-phosphate aminotransferase